VSPPVLEASDLVVRLYAPSGTVHAVNGVSWALEPGRTLAIVGESGSGKTVMTLAPLGLLPPGVSCDVTGSFRFDGRELLDAGETARAAVRGSGVGFVFQDPLSAFNPMRRIGAQIAEPARVHDGLSRRAAAERAAELLALVGLPDARRRVDMYPHELSGGMRQRAMIAMALAANPRVVVADEPTTALDATVQAQIIELLADLQQRLDMALLLITHDIGVVAGMADDVAVMYAGRIVEHGSVHDVLKRPDHPYTRGLLASVPRGETQSGTRFSGLPGTPPDLMQVARGCPFAPRCAYALAVCTAQRPDLEPPLSGETRRSACHVHPLAQSVTEVGR